MQNISKQLQHRHIDRFILFARWRQRELYMISWAHASLRPNGISIGTVVLQSSRL